MRTNTMLVRITASRLVMAVKSIKAGMDGLAAW
jgi:hypothetical protein